MPGTGTSVTDLLRDTRRRLDPPKGQIATEAWDRSITARERMLERSFIFDGEKSAD